MWRFPEKLGHLPRPSASRYMVGICGPAPKKLAKNSPNKPSKVCKTECETYHGLPFAFSTFDEIAKQMIEVSYHSKTKNNQDYDFNISSYYVDAEYNFEDFTWYSRKAKSRYKTRR